MEKQSTFILRLVGKILATVLGISLAVVLIGYLGQWNEPVKFSNAFFWAGTIVIVLGVLSVTGGFTQRANFNMTYAESAGQANLAERAQRTVAETTQRYGTMILLIAAGILLIVVSVVLGEALT